MLERLLKMKSWRGPLTRKFSSTPPTEPDLSKLRFRDEGSLAEKVMSLKSDYSNLNVSTSSLLDRQLYRIPGHPLHTLATMLRHFYTSPDVFRSHLQERFPSKFQFFDNLSPIVSTENNFDRILIPKDHPSRKFCMISGKRSDTYYITKDQLLRTHTSAHQSELLSSGILNFCVLGDVYRKDEIDRTHYPAFHQMEAFRLYKIESLVKYAGELEQAVKAGRYAYMPPDRQNDAYNYFKDDIPHQDLVMRLIIDDLKETHTNLMKFIFGDKTLESRWNPDYFPFTEPSFELEVFVTERWLEVLGSGIVHKDVLRNAGLDPEKYIGWASGIGLERLAMVMYDITDIRLFWSKDQRFLNQFEPNKVSSFKPFSKYPSCHKDISFYLPEDFPYEENEIFEVIRSHGGDLIENVDLVDQFHNKKQKKISRCYRIHYRSLDRTLVNEEIDKIQFAIRDDFEKVLGVELR